MKKKIYIIQFEGGGIPYEPEVFTEKKKADEYYLDFVNKQFGKDFKTVAGAESWMFGEDHDGEDNIRYWAVAVTFPINTKKKGVK